MHNQCEQVRKKKYELCHLPIKVTSYIRMNADNDINYKYQRKKKFNCQKKRKKEYTWHFNGNWLCQTIT